MEPNQNINIIPYSVSSSSSGNLPNDSKKSEKANSKKSILRKEGSQSKNKDKHATFVEPSMNQVAFYIPDLNNLNKNNRISLNTVSEEPEPNSRSGSELINNRNMSYNRNAVNTEQKLSFNNIEINQNSYINDLNNNNNNNNNKSFTYFNNNNSFYDINKINNITNQVETKDNKTRNEVIESKPIIFKNKNIKKPSSRKTLDSDYYLKELSQTNDIFNPSQNSQYDVNSKINIVENNNISSKVVKIRLSNSGRNSISNDNNLNNSLEQYNNLNNNNAIINQVNKLNISNDSSNEKREKREELTKINTEANKNLFNINKQTDPSIGNNDINNNPTNNMINNVSYRINEIISKNKNVKKPNFNKRITMAINKADDEFLYERNNTDINQNLNNDDIELNHKNNDNNELVNNKNNILIHNKERKMPKNNRRITIALNPFDENPDLFDNDFEKKATETVSIQNNSKKLYQDYNNNEEVVYVEPKIIAQNKNINYDVYEKYLKYNNLNYPKSESKINNITNINFPHKDESDNKTGSQTSQKELQNVNNEKLLNSLQNINQNNININNLQQNLPKNKNFIFNLDSSPLIELIGDKSFLSKSNDITPSKQDDKYNLVLNEDENFDIEKEINNQIDFIEKNLEEKEKNWREKIINNAERHDEFESEINKNKNELNNIQYKINEIINNKNELISNKNKYETLSDKAQKINRDLTSAGIEIIDIEHINYKQMNCLLFTIIIKNKSVFKFLISDNIWYEKNVSGESEVTFICVIETEVFSDYFGEETIINRDKNINQLIQTYYNETIKKVFPNEYEKITIHDLSMKYYLATQISICFLHILNMINHISLLDEDFVFNTQDLKKYLVKFNYIDIYSAKITLVYELNIESPFSGNCLKSVEVEQNEYKLGNFNKYRNDTLNLIWKYFNPKDIQINHNYFYNVFLMLGYLDKVRAFKVEINEDYIINVMQGNIKPKIDEFENEENNKFDTLELSHQLEIIYGKKFLEDLVKNKGIINEENKDENNNSDDNDDKDIYLDEKKIENGSNSKDNDEEEIVLDLPSSNNDDEK